jgi:hypothetical protein
MSAVGAIEKLLRLGAMIHDKLDESDESDLTRFLESQAYAEIKASVAKLIAGLPDADIESAINAINEKRKALLGTRAVVDLPNDQMAQYLQLGDARRVLRTKSMAVAANANFLGWLVNTALPVLLRLAPTVLPLLL